MKSIAVSFITTIVICAQVCYCLTLVSEVYFLVDDKAVQTYVSETSGTENSTTRRNQALYQIREDIEYILTETNALLGTLSEYGINLEIRYKKIDILTSDIFLSNTLQNGNIIDGETSIQLFTRYLSDHKTYTSFQHDMAFLLTGYDINLNGQQSTAGIANVGSVCDSVNSVGVVEFNATYTTAIVLAHELAHLCGASHDGIVSDKIMASAADPQHKHRWYFSGCTGSQVNDFLSLLRSNCLLQTNSSSTKPTTSWATYSGRLFDHDVVCQRALNNSRSFMCMSQSLYNNSAPKGDIICQQIFCSFPETNICRPVATSEGMICDTSKRCDNGICSPDSSLASASVDTNCVLGDQKVLELPVFPFNGTCPEYIAKEGTSACYSESVMEMCCATCRKLNTRISGCEYGDRSSQCSTISRTIACSTQNKSFCCGTCQGYKVRRSANKKKGIFIKPDLNLLKGEGYKVEVNHFHVPVHVN